MLLIYILAAVLSTKPFILAPIKEYPTKEACIAAAKEGSKQVEEPLTCFATIKEPI